MNKFVLWFTKVTGWLPQLIAFRRKTYYINKSSQSRSIKGKAIIVSNHNSVYDVAMVMFLFPFRDLYTVVAEVMFQKNKLFSWFLRKIGAIKVNRNINDFDFMNKTIDLLNKGKVVEIYPESRLPNDGEERPLPFKPSTVYIALKSQAPIIPIYSTGEMFKKKRCRVIIGEKIYLHKLYDDTKTEKENIDYLNNYLRNKIIELGNILNEKEEKK